MPPQRTRKNREAWPTLTTNGLGGLTASSVHSPQIPDADSTTHEGRSGATISNEKSAPRSAGFASATEDCCARPTPAAKSKNASPVTMPVRQKESLFILVLPCFQENTG